MWHKLCLCSPVNTVLSKTLSLTISSLLVSANSGLEPNTGNHFQHQGHASNVGTDVHIEKIRHDPSLIVGYRPVMAGKNVKDPSE